MSTSAEPGMSASTRPTTVVWSYRLYLIGAALGLVGIVLSLVLLPATIDRSVQSFTRAAQGRDTQGVDVEALARGAAVGGTVVGVVIAIVLSVLMFVFARKLLQGRNWARIVLLVMAVLQIAGVLSVFGLGALQFIVVAVAAVLSFLPASSEWFRGTRAPAFPTA